MHENLLADENLQGQSLAWAWTQAASLDGQGRMDGTTAKAWEAMRHVLADEEMRLQTYADLAVASLIRNDPEWPRTIGDVAGLCDGLLHERWTPLHTADPEDTADRLHTVMEEAAHAGLVVRIHVTGDPEYPLIAQELPTDGETRTAADPAGHDIEHTSWRIHAEYEDDGKPATLDDTQEGANLEWWIRCLLCDLTAATLGLTQDDIEGHDLTWQLCAATARTIITDLRHQGRYDGEQSGRVAITITPANH